MKNPDSVNNTIQRRLHGVFNHALQVHIPGQKLTPIREWCQEQFGPDLVAQHKTRIGRADDFSFRVYLKCLEFSSEDICSGRWEYNENTVFFKNAKDAMLFRLRWPCRVATMLDKMKIIS